jgi:hypothetical protein
MPTVDELSKRLGATIREKKKPEALNDFALELFYEVKAFLSKEFVRPFPEIQLYFRYGDAYQQFLRDLGVPQGTIDGAQGMYLGNVFSGRIIIDLQWIKDQILQNYVESAVITLTDVLMEELMHSLFPKISDRELTAQRQLLTEKFLPGFKFTDEQKKGQIDAVSGEPKDGYFEPDD